MAQLNVYSHAVAFSSVCIYNCHFVTPSIILYFSEGGVLEGEGDLLEGDEEGGGWDVDAEDLELPPDLVRMTAQ